VHRCGQRQCGPPQIELNALVESDPHINGAQAPHDIIVTDGSLEDRATDAPTTDFVYAGSLEG
jgi:hypothetical protein